jgi:hypothetical protein
MSNYLSDSTAFEDQISRGMLSYRSSELKTLLSAIADYIRSKTDLRIAAVKAAWQEWKERDPKEFANRGIALAGDFEQELRAACERLGVEFDGEDDEEDWEAPAIPKARTVVVNNHKVLKKGAKYTVTYGSSAAGVAQKGVAIAGGVGVKGAVIGGLAAASATGIGGVVAGGVVTVGSSVLALKAYTKTGSHVKNLMDIWNHRDTAELKQCGYAGVANPLLAGNAEAAELLNDRAGHDIVANQVLPYIIKQKSRKMGRKKTSAIPVVGLVEGGRAIANNLVKRWRGTQGQTRLEHARWLANHFCESDCELSRQIVAELYSVEEMYWLLDQEAGDVANFLAEKMQST